jgi:hypothetical protein
MDAPDFSASEGDISDVGFEGARRNDCLCLSQQGSDIHALDSGDQYSWYGHSDYSMEFLIQLAYSIKVFCTNQPSVCIRKQKCKKPEVLSLIHFTDQSMAKNPGHGAGARNWSFSHQSGYAYL